MEPERSDVVMNACGSVCDAQNWSHALKTERRRALFSVTPSLLSSVGLSVLYWDNIVLEADLHSTEEHSRLVPGKAANRKSSC
jgi:hypothetical protein